MTNAEDQDSVNPSGPEPGKQARVGYLVLAYTMLALGIAGAILPLLPATPFLLVAVWASTRGSQRMHNWIHNQPVLARLINDWNEQGAVPLSAKWLATAMMLATLSYVYWQGYHRALLLGLLLLFCVIGGFLWTRPNPKR